jgi:glycosyltransferase involved in cell wall biosynthesis
MRILVGTDAWYPQINGVVRTLAEVARTAEAFNSKMVFITPADFRTVPLPTYPEIRIAIPSIKKIEKRISAECPDAIHIATEGPIGHFVRRYCVTRQLPFTTFFHTRFPEYFSTRLVAPEPWTWAYLRQFHKPSNAVMVSTVGLKDELESRGFRNVVSVPHGVDANLFRPSLRTDLGIPRPIFLFVGRLSKEKNVEAFLGLDLPGSKMVVGDGPLLRRLRRRFPDASFVGSQTTQKLATIYASADVFVFPSRTDTFGLVLLEALASGLPIAAFPAQGPLDIIQRVPVGAIDSNLRTACLRALKVSRETCRAFALEMTWERSTRRFLRLAA